MRVLHVLWSGHVFGAERIVIKISEEMNKKFGLIISVVLLQGGDKNNSLEKVLKDKGIMTFTSRRSFFDFVEKIKSAIRVFKPDIIHSHDYRATMATILATKGIKRSTLVHIAHIHDKYPFMETVNTKSILGLFILLLSKNIIFVSKSALDSIWFKKLIAHKVKIIPNPYLGNNNPMPFEEVSKIKDFDLIFVGRLVPKKHPEKFCEVCKNLNLKCLVVGSGPLENELIEKYGNNILFLGYRNDVEEWLRRSRFLFLPSDYEGFGLVLVEALVNYCIPIVTPWDGVEEIIKQNETGYIVSTDPEAASHEIESLIRNFDSIFPRFYRVREHILQKYSFDKYVNELYQYYTGLVKHSLEGNIGD